MMYSPSVIPNPPDFFWKTNSVDCVFHEIELSQFRRHIEFYADKNKAEVPMNLHDSVVHDSLKFFRAWHDGMMHIHWKNAF